MKRSFWLDLAASGLRAPIGTDLVLHEEPDPEAVMQNGTALGKVIERAAEAWRSPLAIPLMDLRLEKADLLHLLGMAEAEVDTFHFERSPTDAEVDLVQRAGAVPFTRRGQAHVDSIGYIARETSLTPVGMTIGPFSLMTKLMGDPITAVAMAGMGVSGEDDASVRTAERCLALAEAAVRRSVAAQVGAGAAAVIVCEPAANQVYISPKQIESGSDVFERFVMGPDLRLREFLDGAGADLIFHDCGELTTFMVREFATRLHPSMLSLGSSRRLWEDAEVTPRDVVLYGNLPTKNFYSDSTVPLEKVGAMTRELIAAIGRTGHPFILGSECDVLDVPGARDTIRRKVDLMLTCAETEPAVRGQ